jgi:queuine/archaeosine tRNA-ribosyltransferase
MATLGERVGKVVVVRGTVEAGALAPAGALPAIKTMAITATAVLS